MNLEMLLIAFCGLGFGWSCWRAGIRQGASNCIDLLHRQRIIRYDEKGDIKPNQFFQDKD